MQARDKILALYFGIHKINVVSEEVPSVAQRAKDGPVSRFMRSAFVAELLRRSRQAWATLV